MGPAPSASELTGRIVYAEFAQAPDVRQDIYIANADGSGRVLFKPDAAADTNSNPEVSRDGTRVVFESLYREGARSGIYTASIDGSDLRPLVTDGHFASPTFSPDGTRVAYVENRRIGQNGRPTNLIFVAPVDGSSEPRRIPATTENGGAGLPTFSPDGRTVIFVASDERGNAQFYAAPADGSGEPRLTTSSALARGGVLSPDGRRVAFTASEAGRSQIRVSDVDGKNERIIPTRDGGKGGFGGRGGLSFSPDGKFLAYAVGDFNGLSSASEAEALQIYITRADGSSQSRLLRPATNGSASQYAPSWVR